MNSRESVFNDQCLSLVEALVAHLTNDDFDELRWNTQVGQDTATIEIKGPPDVIGRVLGKRRRNEGAIRTLLHSMATRNSFRVLLSIHGDGEKKRSYDSRDEDDNWDGPQDGPLVSKRR